MSKQKREAIGKCPCPVKGCELIIPVYRFGATSTDARFNRHAGRWYCVCPDDGTLGFAGAKRIQDHIADKGEIWGDKPAATDKAAAPQQPAQQAATVTPPQPPAAPAKKGFSLW